MKRKKLTKYDWIKLGLQVGWVLLLGAVIILPPQFVPPVSTWFDRNIRGTINALYFSLAQLAVILVLGLAGNIIISRLVKKKAEKG